ncbi:hypothetical protein JB92DRAFT_95402 [Gautieria morchelliformis]|nr:hypothetical protein JB92DRAFT_95402 [Gautieria morchelliformis]
MAKDFITSRNPTPQLEASLSNLSIGSSSSTSEDWDRSASEIQADPEPPQTPSTSRVATVHVVDTENEGTPGGAKGRQSLSDLLRLHAEKGKDLKLSKEDEQRLSEELGKWINSDSSPYEPDDDFFSRPSRDDSSLATTSSSKASELSGRPRGQSESVLHPGVSGSRPSSAAGKTQT